jgi:hypothetical protein
MQPQLNDDEHDPDALSLPGNTKAPKRSKKKGPRDPKRREMKVENEYPKDG